MKIRLSTTSALAVFAALTVTSQAFAQADRRIPVRKGETPLPPRTDTVVVRDTVRMTDTVTVVRRDTVVQRVEVAPPPLPFGRFYGGLNVGAGFTGGNLNESVGTGWTLGAVGGWDSYRAPLGARFDVGYAGFGNRDEFACGPIACVDLDDDAFDTNFDNPQLWYLNFNGKVRYPYSHDAAWSVYATGGASWQSFRGIVFVDDDDDVVVNGDRLIVLASDDWHNKWGGNIGGGVSFGWGAARLYLESRWQTMNIGNSTQNWVPLVLGVTF